MNLHAPGLRAATQVAFRGLFSLIFLTAGAKHLLAPDTIVGRLAEAPGAALVSGLASPRMLVVLSGAVLLLGGVALLTGTLTRWAAVALFAVLVPITLTVQVGAAGGMGPLFKNVALLGGLLHWAVEGAGPVSVDAWLASRPRLRLPVAGAVGVLALALALPALARQPAVPGAPAGRGAGSTERVFFLVQQPPQLKAVLAAGQQSLKGLGFPAREVEVLVCGPAITSLLAGDAMEARLVEAKQAGIRVVACGLTLAEKGIAPAALSPSVEVVENGLVEALQRQAEGFRSVEL
ncbi:DoxX family membrane protein [Corallococcus sp. AS-1-12]|uniref:DoxX family membrane protein n=1 Tax=Corallococcus sp. AS-1-12 TaxID=2874598 RepID=UPI001CBFC114|nr:DoxX family membrane protein [Corallococcus sp. AS-1-12]MBZ4330160.1 DoxX family membrane protein [Corallococcus sp. AS-1-12]